MANNLVSPGVQVTVIDESNYAPTAVGTTPFILIATAQDKTNASGSIATGTIKANAGKVYTVSSQRELTSLFGLPNFPTDASGNRLYGSELSEYGLHAAFNILDITSTVYLMRADVNLSQLQGSSVRPSSPASGGTLWLNSSATSWGLFSWNSSSQAFTQITPTFLTDTTKLSSNVPIASYGNVGDYVVVGTTSYNPVYTKNYLGNWVLVGSTSWQSTCAPAVRAVYANVTSLTATNSIKINNNIITLSGTTDAQLVAQINALNTGAGITGVTAAMVNNKFTLFATSAAKSNGTDVDGAIKIEAISPSSGATPLSSLGITAGTYAGPTIQFSAHSSVPQWKTINSTPRPSGSVWIKTTAYNYGSNLAIYRRNSVTNTWDLIPATLYNGDADAINGLDPTRGGLGIPQNSLYIRYNAGYTSGTDIAYRVFERAATGPTVATGKITNPTLTAGNTFTVSASQTGSSVQSSPITITVPASPNNTVAGVAAAFNVAMATNNIQNVNASVDSYGHFVYTHATGGTLYVLDTNGTPNAAMGFDNTVPYVSSGNRSPSSLKISNWVYPTELVAQASQPTSVPANGTLWYYSGVQEADIMINYNNVWKGYHTVTQDTRGNNLSLTDPNGPIFSYSAPTTQSDGTPLIHGDLWIDNSNYDSYPVIWRWASVANTGAGSSDQWVQIDTTDSTTENGIVFADVRWDGNSDGTGGDHDIFLDPLVPVTQLLTSNYVDLDAPNPALYPNGCLLFNTRRSSSNIKQYVQGYYNSTNFPLLSLPAVKDTWMSYSGKKWNNVPYFGRQAVRNVVVSAMKEAVINSTDLREEGKSFNLLACPGYVELLGSLKVLNDDRKNTGFIIGEVPMGLTTDTTAIENYLTDSLGTGTTGEDGLNTNDPYTAVFYPGAVTMNPLSGVGSIVVPMSTPMLRTFVRNDQVSEVWFAPAGNTRGVIDNVLSVGYIDRMMNNAFVPTGVPQSLRDVLYQQQVNPITYFPGVGRINYGNHTRQATATALDRINVARLVAYLRQRIEELVRPLVFQPNDKLTRDTAKALIDKLMIDVTTRRGLYDHLVVCDNTNNTNDTIDRNELHIDIAIEPVKAVEFIYIPVRLKATGQIAAGNLTVSTPLG
jgi:hypothetical protein